MLQNFQIIFWIFAMFILKDTVGGCYRAEYISGRKEYRTAWWFAILTFIPIIYTATFRGDVADSHAYRMSFLNMPDTLSGLAAYVPTVTKDKGFTILSGIIKCVIGNNDVLYFFIIAFIQGMILLSVYRKYSSDYVMSVFLFMASTDFSSWMCNGMRQFTAVTIIFAATGFMLRRRWILTILLILLASTIHQSALLMIPVVIIAQGQAWNKRTVFFLAAALVAVLFVDQFTNVLDNMMQETQYANMVTDWTTWNDDGTNGLRVLVYAVPTILSFWGRRYIYYENNEVINLCVNMSIVSTGLYIISMFTSGIFIGRLPIYVSLYNYILLPWEIDHMFTRKSAKIVTLAMIACYLVFYWYQMEIVW